MIAKKKKGITLIETSVVVAILAVMTFAFSAIFVNSLKVYRQEEAETELISNTQTILDRITNDIKSAKSISATNSDYTLSEDILILKTPSLDANQNFIYSGSTVICDYIIYYTTNKSLHRKVVADVSSSRGSQDTELSKEIDFLKFNYNPDILNPNKIGTQITSKRNIGKDTREITLSSKAVMRNQ